MEVKIKNREWVKNAAIVFLAVLLVLTFFSNTIMNRSLPEVATAMVQSGSIVAKVRGTGTVAANGVHQVKAKETRTIRSVMVKVGQEVNAGDVLFVLGEGDETELEQAQEQLRQLELSYDTESLSYPVRNYNAQNRALEVACTNLAAAQDEYDYYDKLYHDHKGEESGKEMERLKNAIDQVGEEIKDLEIERDNGETKIMSTVLYTHVFLIEKAPEDMERGTAYDTAVWELDILQQQYDIENPVIPVIPESGEDGEEGIISGNGEMATYDDSTARRKVSQNDILIQQLTVLNLSRELPMIDGILYSNLSAYNSTMNNKITALKETRAEYQNEYDQMALYEGNLLYKADYEMAKRALDDAYTALVNAQSSLDIAQANDNRTGSQIYRRMQDLEQQMDALNEKIKSLAGEEENVVTANVSGTINTIDCTAGDTVLKDTLMCTIEVPDMGHELSFSVTNDQARRLRVGDTATVSNFYWGNEIVATLSAIRTDPKNPQTNKVLVFELDGDVTTGSELTISVGQKSANYDLIVPNSSIKSDSNGSFVLAVTAKSSPLGNRYIAKRVSIEVLASDDTNSAVVAELSNGDYVITTGSAPINSGDQVRMADS